MLKTIFTSALTAALVCACFYALRQADASRNSSGTFSLFTPGNPVVTGTTISSSWANNTLSDIKTEITDSLSRSGKGGMLAGKQLQIDDGTLTAPGLTSTSETGSGLYRIGSNDWGFAINQVKRQEWTSTGASVIGTFGIGLAPAWPLHVQGATSGATQARFGASGDVPSGLYASTTGSGIDSNATNDGSTGWKYATTNLAHLMHMENSGGTGFVFYTAPSGTAGNAITFTERLRVNTSGITIGSSGAAFAALKKTTVTYNPGATGAGGCDAGQIVNVTNVAFNDVCWATAGIAMGAGWGTCTVSSAGQVTIQYCAFTNTDLASSTWTVWSLQATN